MIRDRLKVALYDAKCQLLRMLRWGQNRWSAPAPKQQHLLLLCPPYSGSTLLHELLSSSTEISPNNVFGTREGMSLASVRQLIDYRQEWKQDYPYPWEAIQQQWAKYWQQSKAILLDKSPAMIYRAAAAEAVFQPAYFIALVRNPYALAESLMRRNKLSASEAAQFVVELLQAQKRNLSTLKKVQLVHYEALVTAPEEVCQNLQNFLPLLGELNYRKTFKAHNQDDRPMPLTDFNERNIKRLNGDQLSELNSVLEQHADILSYFGYSLKTA